MSYMQSALLVFFACSACAPATSTVRDDHPRSGTEDGAFIVLHGADTVAVERFRRTADQIQGELVVNRLLATRYTAALLPDNRVARVETESRRLDRATLSRDSTALRGDSAAAEEGVRWGHVAYLDRSFVMLEQIVRRARAVQAVRGSAGEPVEIPVFRLIGGRTLPARIDFPRPDSAVVEIGGHTFHLQLGGERLLHAHLPGYGVSAVRVSRGLATGAFALENINDPPRGAPYRNEEVKVPAGGGVLLAGTLTIPDARLAGIDGRFPAVVLIAGLGEHNRHGGSPPSTPLREIADALAHRGVAVLRVDERGVAGSTGDRSTVTMFTEAQDVEAAIAFLRGRSEIDTQRLGLIGHSEGGTIAPMIAARDTTVRLVAVLAGLGGPGQEMMEFQVRHLVEGTPSIPPEKRDSVIAALIELEKTISPKVRSIATYDSALVVARSVGVPLLVLHGAADVHVPPAHAERLGAASRAGGNPNVTVRVFRGLNHNFLPDPHGASAGWPFLPSFAVPGEVLSTIAEWVAREFRTMARR